MTSVGSLSVGQLSAFLDAYAPVAYQESYDNVGLLVGELDGVVKGILTTLDVTEAVLDEALAKDCNVIIAHHPIIFGSVKRLKGASYTERVIMRALREHIALYASHTNLDNQAKGGVSASLGAQIGLGSMRVLVPKAGTLVKLTTFVPHAHTQHVLDALHSAGAGQIGAYQDCSFRSEGKGRFTPTKEAQPHLGQKEQPEEVQEERIEVLLPAHLQKNILCALKQAHPYEEVAYYLYPLHNLDQSVGSGVIGKLKKALAPQAFLGLLKEKIPAIEVIKYTPFKEPVQTIALCTGAGYGCLGAAQAQGAQAFVSADFTYHRYFDANDNIMICDIGHFESEIHVKKLLYDIVKEKFPNIAVHRSGLSTQPIRYYY